MINSDIQLKKLRQYLHLTQDEFAERIETKRNNISMIESGRNKPTFDMIGAINKAFGITADYFLSDDTPENYIDQKGNLIHKIDNINDCLNYQTNDYLNSKNSGFTPELSEVELINKIQQNTGKINNLYQRLVDIRILMLQELQVKSSRFSTDTENEQLWELAQPGEYHLEGERYYGYKYENLDFEGKKAFLRKQESCIELFTDTFFNLFRQLYNGIRLPASKALLKEFMQKREEQTSKWTYKHVIDNL